MALTELRKYSVQEKLNKMDLDFIDVTVSPDASNGGVMAAGDILFTQVEIPNAVSVPGGSAILQSCCAIVSPVVTGTFEVVITNDSTTLQHGGGNIVDNDDIASVTSALAVMDGTCGFFAMSNGFDAGACALIFRSNIGMVCKAESDSTSLYVYGIVQNTSDYTQGSIVLRLGFLKD